MNLTRLKRFDKDKHDQLEQFIAWCELMGLTGKDLISLGGHLDRRKTAVEADHNRAIVESIQLDPVGKDTDTDERWTINTVNGRYRFDVDYSSVIITSYKTKKRMTWHNTHSHELGRLHWRKRVKYEVLLDWHKGKLLLNF